MYLGRGFIVQDSLDSFFQFGGSFIAEGKNQDILRWDIFLADQVDNPLYQGTRLSGARTSIHQRRCSTKGRCRFLLFRWLPFWFLFTCCDGLTCDVQIKTFGELQPKERFSCVIIGRKRRERNITLPPPSSE